MEIEREKVNNNEKSYYDDLDKEEDVIYNKENLNENAKEDEVNLYLNKNEIDEYEEDIKDFKEENKENYNILEVIGSGTYGTVYKAKLVKDLQLIAIKKIKIEMEKEGVPSHALREISILQELRHPNIVHLIEVVCREHKLYLIFELLNYDLKMYLESIPENLQLD